ncbi:MAG TPA: hypothetical protein VF456_10835 [Vicinamibacterales bacterium]
MRLRSAAGRTLAYIAAITLAVFWIVRVGPERWAVRIPDETHTYGIRFSGSRDLFFTPPLGWFVDHGPWVILATGLITIGIDCLSRRQSSADRASD